IRDFHVTGVQTCALPIFKRCSAPCVGRIEEADYAELVSDAKDFLAGKSTRVQAKLADAMQAASGNMDFEMAAVYRDRLKALTFRSEERRVGREGTCAWAA